MISTEENTTELKNKKLNEIKYELEKCKAEITNLKERINHLEKHAELRENKFNCIKDLVIWTNEDTNKKEIFRIPNGFNINNIQNVDIDENGLLVLHWGKKGINKVRMAEDLYYFLKEIMPDTRIPIEDLRIIYDKINCKKIVTDEMQKVWEVIIKYRNTSLKTRVIYTQANVSKQTAHNHLNLFTKLKLVNKISSGGWQYKEFDFDRFRQS